MTSKAITNRMDNKNEVSTKRKNVNKKGCTTMENNMNHMNEMNTDNYLDELGKKLQVFLENLVMNEERYEQMCTAKRMLEELQKNNGEPVKVRSEVGTFFEGGELRAEFGYLHVLAMEQFRQILTLADEMEIVPMNGEKLEVRLMFFDMHKSSQDND